MNPFLVDQLISLIKYQIHGQNLGFWLVKICVSVSNFKNPEAAKIGS